MASGDVLSNALISAAWKRDLDGVKKALSEGAFVDHREGGCGETALHYAMQKGDKAIFDYLIESGADVNLEGPNGWTPALDAALWNRGDMLRKLHELGADIEKRNNLGCTALLVASFGGHYDAVKVLLELGANKLAVDKNGQTAIEFVLSRSQGKDYVSLELINLLNSDYQQVYIDNLKLSEQIDSNENLRVMEF